MRIVDAQIHVWDDETAQRPWNQEFAQPRKVFLLHGQAITPDRAVAAMDAVGVDLALVTSFLLYPGISYALDAVRTHPRRFRLVPQVDLAADPLQLAREYAGLDEVVALRLSFLVEGTDIFLSRLESGAYDPIFRLAIEKSLPVMTLLTGHLALAGDIAKKHPGLKLIIDHVGLLQGPHRPVPANSFAGFEHLLRLAAFPNIYVKLTGAPSLSHEPFPFLDIVPRVRELIGAFGPDRIMWGTDFGRTRSMHTYAEGLFYMLHSDRFTAAEKKQILGGTAASLFGL